MIRYGITLQAPACRFVLCLAGVLPLLTSEYQAGAVATASYAAKAGVVADHDGPVQGDSSHILLRGRVIDTSRPIPAVPSALRASPTAGDQLQLIQFAGPVRDGWLEEVVRQGKVEVVTYLPNNAYLIWTDGPTLERLRRLEKTRPFLKWIGDFHPAYRIAPSLEAMIAADAEANRTGQQDLAVTIQFVAHDGVTASIDSVRAMARKVIRDAWTAGSYRNLRVVIPKSTLPAIARLPDVVNVEPWLEPRLYERGGYHHQSFRRTHTTTSSSSRISSHHHQRKPPVSSTAVSIRVSRMTSDADPGAFQSTRIPWR
jgi:hypothetical protein